MSLHKLLLFYITIVLIQFVSCNNECTTRTGEKGRCITVDQCPAIMNILSTVGEHSPMRTTSKLMALRCAVGGPLRLCCVGTPGARTPGASNAGPDPAQPGYYSEAPEAVEDHPNMGRLPINCGHVSSDKTKIGEFPWIAQLVYNSTSGEPFKCIGSIISEKYVLTAAHCIPNLGGTSKLTGVKVGNRNAPTFIAIDKSIINPNFDGIKLQDDIGLLRLASPIDRIQAKPICLPLVKTLQEKQLNFAELSIARWSIAEAGKPGPRVFTEKLSYVPNNLCAELFNATMVEDGVGFRQLCAGGVAGNACDEDAGGPLQAIELINNHQKYYQYGVVSFGPTEYITTGVPTVHARVSHYVKWILDTISR